jgi:AcrR family transcriptional regulator
MLTGRSINSGEPAEPVERRRPAGRRREQLLDAALAVLGARGVEAASMKEIAAAAGVAPGLLYHYFAGKDELILAVIENRGFLPELRVLLAAAAGRPATEVLGEVVAGFSALLSQRAALISLFFSGVAGSPVLRKGLHDLVDDGQRLLAGYLDSRVAAGELRRHDTRSAAEMLFAAIVLGEVTAARPDPVDVVDVLLRGTLRSPVPADAGEPE